MMMMLVVALVHITVVVLVEVRWVTVVMVACLREGPGLAGLLPTVRFLRGGDDDDDVGGSVSPHHRCGVGGGEVGDW